MPLVIDPAMIDALVKRQVAATQQTAPVQTPEQRGGPSTLAKILYATGGGADAASTMYGLHSGMAKENNPLVNWAPKNAQVPLGAAMEVGTLALLNKIIGKSHPKVVDAVLMGLGATHGGLAMANMKTLASAKRDAPGSKPDTIPSNLVKDTDGSYYDPNYFPTKQ